MPDMNYLIIMMGRFFSTNPPMLRKQNLSPSDYLPVKYHLCQILVENIFGVKVEKKKTNPIILGKPLTSESESIFLIAQLKNVLHSQAIEQILGLSYIILIGNESLNKTTRCNEIFFLRENEN